VQKERFFNEEDYLRLKDSYILTPDKLQSAKENLVIMHPLPRVNEISVAIDEDPRACYFKQVMNGKLMRMALIMKLLEVTPLILIPSRTASSSTTLPQDAVWSSIAC